MQPAAPAVDAQPWTVGRLLNWTRQHFESKQVDQSRLSAELLLAEAMSCRKIELYTKFEQVPPAPQVTRFRELVVKAAQHAPIAYLLGRREFYSMEFAVNPDVLIPRPETETLVERALAYCKTLTSERIDVWDMGTGSGCIALALAKYEKRAHVVASDVSEAALAVAKGNVEKHGLNERVRMVVADGPALPREFTTTRVVGSDQSENGTETTTCVVGSDQATNRSHSADGPDNAGGLRRDGGFDLIVSNPPYISEAAVSGLPGNVRDYEPHLALAAGDGLVFYRRLAAEAGPMLRAGGRCMVEIGMGQGTQVAEIFSLQPGWTPIGTWRDMAGIDRVLGFERRA